MEEFNPETTAKEIKEAINKLDISKFEKEELWTIISFGLYKTLILGLHMCSKKENDED